MKYRTLEEEIQAVKNRIQVLYVEKLQLQERLGYLYAVEEYILDPNNVEDANRYIERYNKEYAVDEEFLNNL